MPSPAPPSAASAVAAAAKKAVRRWVPALSLSDLSEKGSERAEEGEAGRAADGDAAQARPQAGAGPEVASPGSAGAKERVPASPNTRRKQKVHQSLESITEESARYAHQGTVPWLSKDGRVIWSSYRIRLAKTITSQQFEGIMGIVIVFNLALIMHEANYGAQCYPTWSDNLKECPYIAENLIWLRWTNFALLVLYTAEACAHMFVSRLGYVRCKWNLLDFIVVVSGWLTIAAGTSFDVTWLRIFRIARLSRAFRIVLSVRELYFLLNGLLSSFKAIFFGTVLLALMLALWSIVLVEFVHPTNASIEYDGCERCSHGYASVPSSMLTLFQTIIAGDSWGMISIPVIEHEPALAIIMVAILVSVSLGVMNLILAVIVESAAEARESDMEQKAKEKTKEQQSTKLELLKLCSDMDKDMSGTLTLNELVDAWREIPAFRRVMQVLDVTHRELGEIFQVLDVDRSGEVDYQEFVDQLYDLRNNDIRLMLALTRLSVWECKSELDAKLDLAVAEMSARTEQQLRAVELNTRMVECVAARVSGHPLPNLKSMPSSVLREASRERRGGSSASLGVVPTQTLDDLQARAEAGTGCESPTEAAGGLSAEIAAAQRRFEVLANSLEADVARRAEEQATLLRRHAMLLSGARKAMVASSSMRRTDTTVEKAAADRLAELSRHMETRLEVLTRDLQCRFDEHAAASASGGLLVDAVVGGLSAVGGGGASPKVMASSVAAMAAKCHRRPDLPPSAWRSPRPGTDAMSTESIVAAATAPSPGGSL